MSFSAPENDTQTTKEVSRRTLVKGAAWAVPASEAADGVDS